MDQIVVFNRPDLNRKILGSGESSTDQGTETGDLVMLGGKGRAGLGRGAEADHAPLGRNLSHYIYI